MGDTDSNCINEIYILTRQISADVAAVAQHLAERIADDKMKWRYKLVHGCPDNGGVKTAFRLVLERT